jgi:plastocyanin
MRRSFLFATFILVALACYGGVAFISSGGLAASAAPRVSQEYPYSPAQNPVPAATAPRIATPAVMVATAASPGPATAGGTAIRVADFAFSPPALMIQVGESVTWTNNDSVPHTTTSDTGVWDSGPLQPGASFSQTFASAGSFTYHCMIHPFMTGSIVVLPASGSVAPAPATAASTPAQNPAGGVLVSLAAGWNLVSGPAGTVLAQASGSLYSLRAGDSGYQVFPSNTPLAAGAGYWAYFGAPVTQLLAASGSQPVSVQAPAGGLVMIGDPFSVPSSVAGADAVYIYDPANGYRPTTTLKPGQGAWAFSAAGATLTIRPASAGG